MIEGLQILRRGGGNPVPVHCTYCWSEHLGWRVGDTIIIQVSGLCGNDPRRYFLNEQEYQDYTKTYREKGENHDAALAAIVSSAP